MRVFAMALAMTLTIPVGPLISSARAAGASPHPVTPVSRGTCNFKTTEIAASASFDRSTSTKFVNLGDAGSISFTQGRTGCVAGSFFANAGNEQSVDHVLLQVLLDGVACAPLTAGYIFANAGDDVSSHTVRFFCGAGIAPGRHTIQVQFASGLGGNSSFFQRTLEVAHE